MSAPADPVASRASGAASFVRRHPGVRWMVPVVIVVIAVLAATGVFTSHASPVGRLPRTTVAALIGDVRTQNVTGFSGTVVSTTSLGLPDLPGLDSGNSVALSSLLAGSQTLQVWYGGADRQRIALLGATNETDVFHDGAQLWEWSSADRVAEHVVGAHPAASPPARLAPVTPSALATTAVRALDRTTDVSVRSGVEVAGRSAYDLVLRPDSPDTTIGSVHIAVDGATKIPLGVAVYPRGSSTPAIDVAFTSISFHAPPARYFHFTPPEDARVRTVHLARLATAGVSRRIVVGRLGTGWTSVRSVATGRTWALDSPVLDHFPEVSGTWGSGRLIRSNLITALVLTDGRAYVGAVTPAVLFAAAAHR